MRTHRILAPLAALLIALALPGAAAAVSPTDAHQWSLGGARPSLNVSYPLRNMVGGSHLRYGSRTFGVDLVWGSSSEQWTLMPRAPPNVRDHRRRALDPSELVAIYDSARRAYLAHGSQTWGIDLTWSSAPRYEWKVDADASGATSLYNTAARDHVVYGARPFGINLRWLKDLRRDLAQSAPGSLHDATVTLRAQPIVQGYVPFLGTYGGGVNFDAVLTKVSNPPGGAPLFFVKPGYSTEQCGTAAAVTYLAPGASMTADQLRTLYGSAQPSLKQGITFLACAGTQAGSAFLNIQWRQL
jgi:hypothetical protein